MDLIVEGLHELPAEYLSAGRGRRSSSGSCIRPSTFARKLPIFHLVKSYSGDACFAFLACFPTYLPSRQKGPWDGWRISRELPRKLRYARSMNLTVSIF